MYNTSIFKTFSIMPVDLGMGHMKFVDVKNTVSMIKKSYNMELRVTLIFPKIASLSPDLEIRISRLLDVRNMNIALGNFVDKH